MRSISSPPEFQEMFNSGIRREGKLFNLLFKYTPGQTAAAGMIVSKKIGKAVTRNKIKRRIRSYLREYFTRRNLELKIVIIAKPQAVNSDWQVFREDLDYLFSNI
jgi:ribonuclease P protein component